MRYPENPDDPPVAFPGVESKFTRALVAQVTAFEAKRPRTRPPARRYFEIWMQLRCGHSAAKDRAGPRARSVEDSRGRPDGPISGVAVGDDRRYQMVSCMSISLAALS